MATNMTPFNEDYAVGFEDYRFAKQVLTASENGIENDFNKVKISSGEEATTDVFNRGIVASLNRDASLESALTYLARSTSLYTTENTVFLSHCEPKGKGVDVIGNVAPTKSDNGDDFFLDDDVFLGAELSLSRIENMLGIYSKVDTHLKSETGWAITNPTGTFHSFSKDNNLFVSSDLNTDNVIPGTVEAHTVTIALEKMGLVAGDKISASIDLLTNNNMIESNVIVELAAEFFAPNNDNVLGTDVEYVNNYKANIKDINRPSGDVDAVGVAVGGTSVIFDVTDLYSPEEPEALLNKVEGSSLVFYTSPYSEVEEKTIDVQYASYKGTIKLENIVVPEKAVTMRLCIHIKFNSNTSYGTYKFKDIMLSRGDRALPYCESIRQPRKVSYEGVVKSSYGDISVLDWAIFPSGKYSDTTINTSPICLTYGDDNAIIGNRVASGDNTKFALQVEVVYDGVTYKGNEITIPVDKQDTYLLNGLRLRKNEADTSKAIAEFVILYDFGIKKSSVSIPASALPENAAIQLGYNKSTNSYFNGRVTEVRYDKEWLNDTELYVIYLSKRAYTLKQYIDIPEDEEIKDGTAVNTANLILNPTGKLGYIGWSNYPNNFIAVHNDTQAGNCFIFTSPTEFTSVDSRNNERHIYSNFISVLPFTTYSLTANMYSYEGTTGKAGIGIQWYSTNDPSSYLGKEVLKYVDNSGELRSYVKTTVSPALATYARVFMFVEKGIATEKISWSNLKLEIGDPSYFSDDTGAQYAVYYGTDDLTEDDLEDISVPSGEVIVSKDTTNKHYIVGVKDFGSQSLCGNTGVYLDTKDGSLVAKDVTSDNINVNSQINVRNANINYAEVDNILTKKIIIEGTSIRNILGVDILDLIYPIGSIICLASNTNPNSIYQNTLWIEIEGRVVIGSDDVSSGIGSVWQRVK